jgi:hypothetical protein
MFSYDRLLYPYCFVELVSFIGLFENRPLHSTLNVVHLFHLLLAESVQSLVKILVTFLSIFLTVFLSLFFIRFKLVSSWYVLFHSPIDWYPVFNTIHLIIKYFALFFIPIAMDVDNGTYNCWSYNNIGLPINPFFFKFYINFTLSQ